MKDPWSVEQAQSRFGEAADSAAMDGPQAGNSSWQAILGVCGCVAAFLLQLPLALGVFFALMAMGDEMGTGTGEVLFKGGVLMPLMVYVATFIPAWLMIRSVRFLVEHISPTYNCLRYIQPSLVLILVPVGGVTIILAFAGYLHLWIYDMWRKMRRAHRQSIL